MNATRPKRVAELALSGPRSPQVVDFIMERIPPSNYRWCDTPVCCCVGCVNPYVLQTEWEDWKSRHHFCQYCQRWSDILQLHAVETRIAYLKDSISKEFGEIEQILGKALMKETT